MLLQTIKSRNLWLWGELISDINLQSDYVELLSKRNILQAEISSLESKLTSLNKQGKSEEAKIEGEKLSEKQQEFNSINSELKQANKNSNVYNITSKVSTPFKITALQSIDVTWDNPIGESYGLTSNFLQSWHNKPVNINFKGISYMGAFGGSTVGSLNSVNNDTNISNEESSSNFLKSNVIASTVSSGISAASNLINKLTSSNYTGIRSDASVEGKYEIVIDQDVEKINKLLSYYGEGLYPKQKGSPYIYLLMENPGSGSNNEGGFVTFIGHIKNFTYSERTDKPFLYDYTVQFVGEPTIENKIRNAEISAKQDASSVKLTVVTSESGYSLGYGW